MSYNKQSLNIISTSLVAQTVKRLPMIWEPQARSLGWEDPLEKGMAAHFSILAWRILMHQLGETEGKSTG